MDGTSSNEGRTQRKRWPDDYEAGKADKGVLCPRCGCGHAPVINTRQIPGQTVRYRQCRHCGRRFTTFEVNPSEVAPQQPQADLDGPAEADLDPPAEAEIEAAEPPRRPRKRHRTPKKKS